MLKLGFFILIGNPNILVIPSTDKKYAKVCPIETPISANNAAPIHENKKTIVALAVLEYENSFVFKVALK